MCRSVPQMDAARTRTSTSVGPGAGMLTDSRSAPRCGRILRKAFIVGVGIGYKQRICRRQNRFIVAHGFGSGETTAYAHTRTDWRGSNTSSLAGRQRIRATVAAYFRYNRPPTALMSDDNKTTFGQRLREIREGFEPAFWVANISE